MKIVPLIQVEKGVRREGFLHIAQKPARLGRPALIRLVTATVGVPEPYRAASRNPVEMWSHTCVQCF